jgi:hypothetical protein
VQIKDKTIHIYRSPIGAAGVNVTQNPGTLDGIVQTEVITSINGTNAFVRY